MLYFQHWDKTGKPNLIINIDCERRPRTKHNGAKSALLFLLCFFFIYRFLFMSIFMLMIEAIYHSHNVPSFLPPAVFMHFILESVNHKPIARKLLSAPVKIRGQRSRNTLFRRRSKQSGAGEEWKSGGAELLGLYKSTLYSRLTACSEKKHSEPRRFRGSEGTLELFLVSRLNNKDT